MATENQQAVANVLWLAELECPVNSGQGPGAEHTRHWDTCVGGCQGTGAKYPQLREIGEHGCCQKHTSGNPFKKCCWAGGRYGDCQGREWLPVSREKAGTELRKLETFQKWVHDEYKTVSSGFMLRSVVELLCNDNATIAATRKMEEHAQI